MRKVIVGAFVSLDGVMQAPGGPHEDPRGGFRHGGWVAPWFDEALGAAVGSMMGRPFDLLQVMTFPVVLGQGRRLFDDSSHARAFKLVSSSATANGVTISLYERGGDVPTGDFGEDVTEAELERRRVLG